MRVSVVLIVPPFDKSTGYTHPVERTNLESEPIWESDARRCPAPCGASRHPFNDVAAFRSSILGAKRVEDVGEVDRDLLMRVAAADCGDVRPAPPALRRGGMFRPGLTP